MQTNTDLTLYSRSVVNGAEVWTRTVIDNVLWTNRKAVNVIQSGLMDANAVEVYISTHGRTDEIVIKPGDVIAEGIVTRQINTEYTIGNLKRDYSDVATVKSVDRYDFGSSHMHHLMIGAS
jgi:hypothetical protein